MFPKFNYDPIKPLLASPNTALVYFTERDLLDREAGSIEIVRNLPEVLRIIKKQQANGSWKPGRSIQGAGSKASLLETWKQFRFLVDQYQLNKTHPAIEKAALTAAALLKSKFLKKDNWSWYEHPDNWVRFQFPYWWNHLVSPLADRNSEGRQRHSDGAAVVCRQPAKRRIVGYFLFEDSQIR